MSKRGYKHLLKPILRNYEPVRSRQNVKQPQPHLTIITGSQSESSQGTEEDVIQTVSDEEEIDFDVSEPTEEQEESGLPAIPIPDNKPGEMINILHEPDSDDVESLGSDSPREEFCDHGYTVHNVDTETHDMDSESDDDESLIEVIFPYAEDTPREDANAQKIREISHKVSMDSVGRETRLSQEQSNFQKIRELSMRPSIVNPRGSDDDLFDRAPSDEEDFAFPTRSSDDLSRATMSDLTYRPSWERPSYDPENEGNIEDKINPEAHYADSHPPYVKGKTPVSTMQEYQMSELTQMKMKAIAIEKDRLARQEAALTIQRIYRGHLARRLYQGLLIKYDAYIRNMRLKRICRRIKILFAPQIIQSAILRYVKQTRVAKANDKFGIDENDVNYKFLNFAAEWIQKSWRQWQVRKAYKLLYQQRMKAKQKITRLAQTWKLRQILKLKPLVDMKKEWVEMKQIIDDPTTDTSIFEMVLMKYPRQLRRYVETIDRYMHSSDWVGMKNARRESMKQPKFLPKYDEPSRFAPVSDTSKTPSYQDYDMQEFPDEENTVTPKRKFTNFLRRAKPKYDPSSKLRDRRATTSDIPIEVIQRKQWEQTPVIPEVIEPSAPDSPPNINIIEPPEDKRQTTPKPFLRRKSQAVVPAKVKWNAKSRTDCWSEQKSTTTEQKLTHSISANQIKNKRARRSSTPTPKETVPEELDRSWSESRPKTSKPKKLEPKTKKKVPAKVDSRSVTPNPSMPNKAPPEEPVYAEPEEQLPTEGNVLKTEMLETIFNVLNADHIPVIEYLASRSNTDSAIPQFHGRSFFVTHFTEDIYADTLEALENHYNYLCSEDAC